MNTRVIVTGLFLTGWLLAGCATGQAPTATVTAPTATPTAAEAVSTPASGVTATTDASPSVEATTETATASTAQDATPNIVAAANAFLATLSDSEQEAVLFDWSDTAQKQRWSNFPEGLFERAGLMWGDLSETQQTAWLAVMQATLSTEGYNRVIAEWNADEALTTQEGGAGGPPDEGPGDGSGGPPDDGSGGGPGGGQLLFGKQYYWIALIGTPSETDPWQWQWGGHHVTVNATIAGSNLSLTPSFIGVQPATYTGAEGNPVRPLGDIDDEAFALVNSLDAAQQQAAILGSSSIDLVLGPGEDGRTIQAEGLPASQMTAEQQATFLQLIGHYTGLANDEDAAVRLAEIETSLDETYLAWYGSTTQGDAAYFRVTGPSIVIEYSTQSLGGNPSNHIHGVYRDPTNDYGVEYTQ